MDPFEGVKIDDVSGQIITKNGKKILIDPDTGKATVSIDNK
jgi:hypothetical protein